MPGVQTTRYPQRKDFMTTTERIRSTIERSIRAMELRPTVGRRTAVSRARVADGTTCEITEGRWSLVSDLSEKGGGDGQGPDPGVLGRAALGSCLAIGVKMWAAYRGVAMSAVDVTVEADFDVAAQYGVGESPPGYTEVRYAISVESDAPEADVVACIDEVVANSPWVDVFARAQPMVKSVTVNAPKE